MFRDELGFMVWVFRGRDYLGLRVLRFRVGGCLEKI